MKVNRKQETGQVFSCQIFQSSRGFSNTYVLMTDNTFRPALMLLAKKSAHPP